MQLQDGALNQFVSGKRGSRVTSGPPPLISHDPGWDFVANRPAEVVNSN